MLASLHNSYWSIFAWGGYLGLKPQVSERASALKWILVKICKNVNKTEVVMFETSEQVQRVHSSESLWTAFAVGKLEH